MEFFNSARKVVIPIRNAIGILDLSLDKHFDQINSIPLEHISLIGLITENNSCVSQNKLTTAGVIVYNYKKGTHKHDKSQYTN